VTQPSKPYTWHKDKRGFYYVTEDGERVYVAAMPPVVAAWARQQRGAK